MISLGGKLNFLRITARFVILSLLTLFLPPFRWIAQAAEEWKERLQAERNAKKAIEEFRDQCESLGMSASPLDKDVKRRLIRELVDEDVQFTPDQVYPQAAPEYFTEEPSHRVDARLAVTLCDIIDDKESSAAKHSLKKSVERALADYDFSNIGNQEREILRAFEVIVIDNESSDQEIFEGDLLREEEELVETLLKQYTVNLYEKYLLIDSKKAEEMRATLAQLVRDGELDLPSLHSEVIQGKMDEIKAQLRDANQEYSGYFLFDHRLFTKGKRNNRELLYARNPLVIRVAGTEKYGDGYSGEGLKPVLHIVFTEDNYSSAIKFLQNEILTVLPEREDWDENAMVAALPFETGDWGVLPEKEELMKRDWKKTYEENFEDIDTMAGRSESIASSLTVDWVVSKADVEELLQVIPVNVFIPDRGRDVRNVVRNKDNYGQLKKTFEIESLFDWATISGDDLGRKLSDLDEDDVLDDSEWKNVGNDIVEAAEKAANATIGNKSNWKKSK